MQFLNPIWFFALAAMAIPVIIHLWNIRPGKTLKVGSISLISEASKTSRRSLKLLDILLLLIRCLLLVLLAMLLAVPIWQSQSSAPKSKGWFLIPKETLKETYQKFKPVIDSLDKAGFEFHYFDRGFAKQDLKALLANTAVKDTVTGANYWALAKHLKSNLPVYIFTQNGVAHFKGSKPRLKLNELHWQTYTANDSVARWVASAAFTNGDGIKVTDGISTPGGTTYLTSTVTGNGDTLHTIRVQNGRTEVGLKNNNDAPVIVDTTTMRIAVYTDKYSTDASYLRAALSAAVGFNGTRASIKLYNTKSIPPGNNWVFWLSEQQPDNNTLRSTKHIFRYAVGKPESINSWIEPGHIILTRRIPSDQVGTAIWKDGYGRPLLGLKGNTYQFYSHFNPQWGDLVWSDDFPKLMLKLLFDTGQSQPQKHERRILTNRQIQPETLAQAMSVSLTDNTEQTALSPYFWLLVIALFIVERVLAYKKVTSNG